MPNVTIDDIRRSINKDGNDASEVKKNLTRLRTMRKELVRILSHKIDQFESINTFDTRWRLEGAYTSGWASKLGVTALRT